MFEFNVHDAIENEYRNWYKSVSLVLINEIYELMLFSWIRDSVHGWVAGAVADSSRNSRGEQVVDVESKDGVRISLLTLRL